MTLPLSRRDYLKLAAAGVLGGSMSGWLEALANDTAKNPERKKSCILLWMTGGPSQMDTFDLKVGHANGGPFKDLETSAPGLRISEHLPKIAKFGDKMAVIRGMSTKEGDHFRATNYLHTGYLAQGPVRYPPLGALVSSELGNDDAPLPNFVSIAGSPIYGMTTGGGFLGPKHAALVLGNNYFARRPEDYEQSLRVPDLAPPSDVTNEQADARIGLLEDMQKDFTARHSGAPGQSRQTAYDRAVRLMQTNAARAFNLDAEPAKLRDRYGRNLFGQGCLLARRLVEQGVPFIEVTLDRAGNQQVGWDTHSQNFDGVKALSGVLDPAWATLMEDLKDKGLLDSTLIVWMGEFGRTPKINGQQGRDHYPNAWSTVLAGGGIKGGQAVGKTSRDGTTVEERPVSVPDFLATACKALGIDPMKQNRSNVDRPIRIVDKAAESIKEVLAS